MTRRPALAALLAATLLGSGSAAAAPPGPERPTAGSVGLGDPYYPSDGNGGYDVASYDLDLRYEPATDRLDGTATIQATSTHALSRFNLDLDGLTVSGVTVNGAPARWSRPQQDELRVTPAAPIANGAAFTVVVTYGGVPQTQPDQSGFLHTDDGAWVAGQPHGASSWFPANDHPLDPASFRFDVDVPAGLEVVANGVHTGTTSGGGRSVWTWVAVEPMATYLATLHIGEYALTTSDADGIPLLDAIDPDLDTPTAAPTQGSRFALSGIGDLTYKRLLRELTVPAGGATLGFTLTRNTEQDWDFVFVEAHTVGQDDWTTLPDANGHTSPSTGNVCPLSLELHPFLAHYQTPARKGGCEPQGTTGSWWAATGISDGAETWSVDLAPFAGRDIEVAIAYVSDDIIQWKGAYVDAIVVSTGEGSTSFEDDGDPLDGWTVPGAPAGSAPNVTDWTIGTAADVPPSVGADARSSLARQPEVLEFLAGLYGPYPFSTSGGIVDDDPRPGFALETQTRPVYSRAFFELSTDDSVVVHELAHQWLGDDLRVAAWSEIWANEGFATYSEWLWSEDQGLGTANEIATFFYDIIPAEDPFWQVVIGDPGASAQFDIAIYFRGAMALDQLRLAIGDDAFFELLRTWTTTNAGSAITIAEFIALAESISGQQLDDLFTAWLDTPGKPALLATPAAATARAGTDADRASSVRHAPTVARKQVERYAPAWLD